LPNRQEQLESGQIFVDSTSEILRQAKVSHFYFIFSKVIFNFSLKNVRFNCFKSTKIILGEKFGVP